MSDSISINKVVLQHLIDDIHNALEYSKKLSQSPDHGFAYSFGYLESKCNSISTILQAYHG